MIKRIDKTTVIVIVVAILIVITGFFVIHYYSQVNMERTLDKVHMIDVEWEDK